MHGAGEKDEFHTYAVCFLRYRFTSSKTVSISYW
jgi:hypothetical protein